MVMGMTLFVCVCLTSIDKSYVSLCYLAFVFKILWNSPHIFLKHYAENGMLFKLHWIISITQRESMADLDIDGDRLLEDDLESDSESVEVDVLEAVSYFFN